MAFEFLACLGRAVLRHGAKQLADNRPLDEALSAIAGELLRDWQERRLELAHRRAELEGLAQAPAGEARRLADQTAQQLAPPPLRPALAAYLEQLPETIRRSFTRRDDPAGHSMPPDRGLEEPRDLLLFLLPRAPRFRAGQQPLPQTAWVLEKLLGIGGFGEVWKAANAQKQTAALKFCFGADAAKVVRHEMKIHQQLAAGGGHPGIVQLRQGDPEAKTPFLEFDYVAGGDLARLIRDWAEAPPPDLVDRSLGLLRDLAEVLAFAHRLRPPVVHRDLKPANILLQATKIGPAVQVTDFGIGGLATHLVQMHTQTRQSFEANLYTRLAGAFTGGYASARQMKGDKPDPQDDVYSLGIIAYRLLTCDLLKDMAKDWDDILRQRGTPAAVVEVLKRCLASSPKRWLANAADLAQELAPLDPSWQPPWPPPAKPPPPRAGDIFTNALGMKFASVPKGTFWMSENDKNARRQVAIPHDFYLGIYPVTQEQWQAVMGKNPSAFSRTGDDKDKVREISDADLKQFPVETVSWEDAQEFVKKLNARDKDSGWLYRLPAEAEWEYACRGGATSKEECSFDYYFDQPTNDLSSTQANFNGNNPAGKAPKGPYLERPTKVGSYKSNRLGIYDMHGNVWEWCEDLDKGASSRVIRGGSWSHYGWRCRSAYRSGFGPDVRYLSLGFRVAAVQSR